MKSTIKKTMIGILAAGMVLFIGTTMAFAGGHRGDGHHRNTGNHGICGNRSVYVEENFSQSTAGCNYTDTDNDGICDNCDAASKDCLCGRGNGTGCNYTDTDNDGICDNCDASSKDCLCVRENGTGRNYTDADNDGICDNRTDKSSSGGRRGFCGRNRK